MDVEKPVQDDAVIFPPFPDPEDIDFEDDIGEEEREYYKSKFPDLHMIKDAKLHCSACDRHLGCATVNENRMRMHPMLRTLVCNTCHTFYNSGEFEKGEDGSELYCRWCGQGGQVYCCSDCCHVFCAKCIKRNLGIGKIKEIENTDDWKCFKCSPHSLWDLRAICWALLRYCDLKNKLVYKTEDPVLKMKYQADCAVDHTDVMCCKRRSRTSVTTPRERPESSRKVKEEKKEKASSSAASIISKIPATIQVKKFASINLDDEKKKPRKRSASPKTKATMMKNPIAIAPYINSPTSFINSPTSFLNTPTSYRPPVKKIKFPAKFPTPSNNTGFNSKNFTSYLPPPAPRLIRAPKNQSFSVMHNQSFNGFSNLIPADNINLSLESLTQGLDMAAMAAMNNQNNSMNDDVVCTPDFPMEPLCEVFEDNNDDDVECISGPVAAPKQSALPTLAKPSGRLPELTPENIVQMTDNDVTVNAITGGLKFRVDPQTLSSNKMYRLPDGRIFAINANPNMPGGYSATIVAVTENGGAVSKPAPAPRGATYAAKLSAVSTGGNKAPPPPLARIKAVVSRNLAAKPRSPAAAPAALAARRRDRAPPVPARAPAAAPAPAPAPAPNARQCDLAVPVEWYRYNVIEAADALEYSLARVRKLKRDATTQHLRTRTQGEMRALHHALERLLLNSAERFKEVARDLNEGYKTYLQRKSGGASDLDDDDDDDVEILPAENDDPIFIDENSLDSDDGAASTKDVEEIVSSDLNDSGERDKGEAGDEARPGERARAETDKDDAEPSAPAVAGDDSAVAEPADEDEPHDATAAADRDVEHSESASKLNGDADKMDVSEDNVEREAGNDDEDEPDARDKPDEPEVGDKPDEQDAGDIPDEKVSGDNCDDANDEDVVMKDDDEDDDTAAAKNNSTENSDVAHEEDAESIIPDKISETNYEKVDAENAEDANEENHLLKENNESVLPDIENKHDSDFDEDLLDSLLKDDGDDVTSAQKKISLESDSLTA